MLRATVVRSDASILIDDVEILARTAKRGCGDGLIWRGVFSVPMTTRRPEMGDTMHLRLDDSSEIGAVVVGVVGRRIHLRVRGKGPAASA